MYDKKKKKWMKLIDIDTAGTGKSNAMLKEVQFL